MVPAIEKNFPLLCGYHLWQGIGRFAIEPRWSEWVDGLDLPHSWYSDLCPHELKDMYIAVEEFIRSDHFHPKNEESRQEMLSLRECLFHAAECGYGTKASY